MKIQLKQLALINFKGIRNKTISLNPDGDAFIYGNNATGKTTVFDAFTWLLFGKDSAGRSDFEIKTLDVDGFPIERLDHEVAATLIIDGKEVIIKRTLREKWVKKRGAEVTEFEGNETLLSVNDVPKKANEFKDYISAIINESLFKLITSPTAFNSLPWQERRKILNDICGEVSSDEVISLMEVDADRKQFLLNILAGDTSIVDHKKAIAQKVKALKDEIKTIPTRIDEVERSKPDLSNIDLSKTGNLEELKLKSDSIDSQIADKSKAFDAEVQIINLKKKSLFEIESKISERERLIKSVVESQIKERDKLPTQLENDLHEATANITTKQNQIIRNAKEVESINEQIDRINKSIVEKRNEWTVVNAKTFTYDPTSICCPTCKQELKDKDSKIEELKANFNTAKANELEQINSQGGALKKKLEALELELKQTEAAIITLTKEVDTLTDSRNAKQVELDEAKGVEQEGAESIINTKISIDVNLAQFVKDKATIEAEIKNLTDKLGTVDNAELLAKKAEIFAEVERLKYIQRKINDIAKADERIEELKAQEKQLAQAQAQIERDEFLLNKFTKSMTEQIETRVNSMFEIVKFKMFEQQINGGESETCVCTVNGVSYPDLNNAMKIQAGLDIIKTLSAYYKVSAPIFIDNRESVVNIGKQDAQIINLVVSADDKELRIV